MLVMQAHGLRIRSGLMRRRRLIVLFYGPLRPSPNRSSRHHSPPRLARWGMAQSLQIDGENIRQAHTVNSVFVLRALAAWILLQTRIFGCRIAAEKPVIRARRSERKSTKDQVADKALAHGRHLEVFFEAHTNNEPTKAKRAIYRFSNWKREVSKNPRYTPVCSNIMPNTGRSAMAAM
jgi:hypothetical protein